MEKVLLAVAGNTPDQKAFQYAIDLCTRTQAELKILLISAPQTLNDYLGKVKNSANQAKHFFEGSMMAATFAEEGEHTAAQQIMAESDREMTRLTMESAKVGISCQVSLQTGNPRDEIVRYVRENKDVAIAIYDDGAENTGNLPKPTKRQSLKSIAKALPIPIVTIQKQV